MRIIISGGTGFVGNTLARRFIEHGHEVTILTRGRIRWPSIPEKARVIECDPTRRGSWQERVAANEVIINLAGASIFRRWTFRGKKEIISSRVLTTRNLVEALAIRKPKETQFFNASGIGYYGFHEDEILDEDATPGADFLATVAEKWEYTALGARQSGTRLVICRLGHVLGTGGVLPKLITLSRLHLGSHWGRGRQWVSWIHQDDMTRVFLYLLERKDISGPVNVTAPNPVRNSEMMDSLSRLMQTKPLVPPVPGFILRLLTGEFATVFLHGQRVLPRALLDSGFVFAYPFLDEALRKLLQVSRGSPSQPSY